MEISKRKEKDALVISLKGRLDAVTSPVLEKDLTDLMAGGERFLVLDLEDLDYISSAGTQEHSPRRQETQGKAGQTALGFFEECGEGSV